MKKIIEKVLEEYADRQINLASEAARGELAEKICRAVGDDKRDWVVFDESDHPLTKSDEGQMYNRKIAEHQKKWLDKNDKTSEYGGV